MINCTNIYGKKVINFLSYFLKHGKNEETLISQLRMIEFEIREEIYLSVENNCDLWFRFYRGDTLATTINNIERDLKTTNRETLIESFELAVENDYIEIYFS